jgi:hypothetical protein
VPIVFLSPLSSNTLSICMNRCHHIPEASILNCYSGEITKSYTAVPYGRLIMTIDKQRLVSTVTHRHDNEDTIARGSLPVRREVHPRCKPRGLSLSPCTWRRYIPPKRRF